jgi:hypothetical protein
MYSAPYPSYFVSYKNKPALNPNRRTKCTKIILKKEEEEKWITEEITTDTTNRVITWEEHTCTRLPQHGTVINSPHTKHINYHRRIRISNVPTTIQLPVSPVLFKLSSFLI